MTGRALLYLIVVIVSSGCGLAVEITAGRMIAPYLGMSLYTWTAIIAVVLAGFSVGHWIGGRLAEAEADRVRRRVAWALGLAGLSTLASLVLLRVLSGPVIGFGLSPVPTILLLTFCLFFLPSVFVGIPSPALVKLALDDDPDRPGPVLGAFFAGGAIGSIVGTLATGFVFISYLGSAGTLILIAGLYVTMAVMLLIGPGGGARSRDILLPVVSIGFAAVLLGLAGFGVKAFVSNCDTESDYYCIRIIDASAEANEPARLMVLDHLAHGINLKDSPERLVTPYVDMQDMLARIHSGRRSPFRTFFIGGGGYTLPRAWLAARPDADVSVAEIDPEVTRAAERDMWLVRDDRLTVLHRDARQALVDMPDDHFDIIVGDAFHDIAVPAHLVTLEFFALVREKLIQDGIYLMNVVDSREQPRLALSIMASLAPVFPVVEIWALEPSSERTTYVVAGLAEATAYARLALRSSPGQAFVRLEADRLVALAKSFGTFALTDDFAPVDRLIGVQ